MGDHRNFDTLQIVVYHCSAFFLWRWLWKDQLCSCGSSGLLLRLSVVITGTCVCGLLDSIEHYCESVLVGVVEHRISFAYAAAQVMKN